MGIGDIIAAYGGCITLYRSFGDGVDDLLACIITRKAGKGIGPGVPRAGHSLSIYDLTVGQQIDGNRGRAQAVLVVGIRPGLGACDIEGLRDVGIGHVHAVVGGAITGHGLLGDGIGNLLPVLFGGHIAEDKAPFVALAGHGLSIYDFAVGQQVDRDRGRAQAVLVVGVRPGFDALHIDIGDIGAVCIDHRYGVRPLFFTDHAVVGRGASAVPSGESAELDGAEPIADAHHGVAVHFQDIIGGVGHIHKVCLAGGLAVFDPDLLLAAEIFLGLLAADGEAQRQIEVGERKTLRDRDLLDHYDGFDREEVEIIADLIAHDHIFDAAGQDLVDVKDVFQRFAEVAALALADVLVIGVHGIVAFRGDRGSEGTIAVRHQCQDHAFPGFIVGDDDGFEALGILLLIIDGSLMDKRTLEHIPFDFAALGIALGGAVGLQVPRVDSKLGAIGVGLDVGVIRNGDGLRDRVARAGADARCAPAANGGHIAAGDGDMHFRLFLISLFAVFVCQTGADARAALHILLRGSCADGGHSTAADDDVAPFGRVASAYACAARTAGRCHGAAADFYLGIGGGNGRLAGADIFRSGCGFC